MKLSWLSVALVSCVVIQPFAGAGDVPAVSVPNSSVPDAVKSITAREIGGHLRFLASDLMKGRDTTSPELRVAGEYLAAHLFGAGAEPLGDQGRERPDLFPAVPARGRHAHGGRNRAVADSRAQRLASESCPASSGPTSCVFPRGIVAGEIEAPIVFAGYGRVDPDRKIDDYAGLDVKNRFVLVYSGQPGAAASRPAGRRPAHATRCRCAMGKREPAQKNGALGVLEIQPPGHGITRPGRFHSAAETSGFRAPA